MSNNAPDYNDNLAFPPQGDWSDTQPKITTDRTQSTIELVEKFKELTEENTKLKGLLRECRGYIEYVGYLGVDTILNKIDEVLK